MAQYNALERRIAKILESQPWLHDAIRNSYKRLVYLKNKKKYEIELNENYIITDIAAFVGLEKYDGFFFGYYDKCPWNEAGTKYLAHTLADNTCYVTICDFTQKNYQHIANTKAWNYQQGCMTQWMNEERIIYNIYNNKMLGAVLYNINTKQEKFIPYPVQVFNRKKQEYLSINYRRLSWLRPDYGYIEECDNFSVKQDYSKDGIWLVDTSTSNAKLIIKISDLVNLTPVEFQNSNHKVNHLYYSPCYERFVFLHRWIDKRGKYSRLYCCDCDGKNLKLLLDHRMISHYSWINDNELIVWARTPEHGDAYITLNATTETYDKLDDSSLSKYGDGHPTINSLHNYVITDTYPDKSRLCTLLLYDVSNKQKTELGKFFAPWIFEAEKRCDLHPRFKTNSNDISIDSAHEGIRKNYIIKNKRYVVKV